MLYWLVFLTAALAVGVHFGALSAAVAGMAKVLFVVFLGLILVDLVVGRAGLLRSPPG